MVDLKELNEAIIRGRKTLAEELTQKALAEGMDPHIILNQGLVAGMEVVGEKFKCNEFYVPEVLVAARAMKAALELLRPYLAERKIEPKARIVIGTVQGDLHDIGKNLVSMMLEGAGYEMIDLGVDVSPQMFVEAVQKEKAKVVAMSALLTTTMGMMKDTIEAFKEAGIRDKVLVIVGGAPITQKFADQIGADGYAPDAASAVDKVNELLGMRS